MTTPRRAGTRTLRTLLLVTASSLLAPAAAFAQATPADDAAGSTTKTDAKSLLASGVKLFAAKDYLGALVVFKDAYSRFRSSKILLNIATTLNKLDRKAEAANAYQRYLDADDADPAKRPEVERVLAELDHSVGVVELTVTPADAEVQLGDDDWQPAASAKKLRVPPGGSTIYVRHAGYSSDKWPVDVAAGTNKTLAITMSPIPIVSAGGATSGDDRASGGDLVLHGTLTPATPRSRIGMLAIGHFDISHKGGAALVGLTADVTPRFQGQAAALLGKHSGGYVGASFALMTGTIRPTISAGLPFFVANGARFAVRGAGGVEIAVNRHVAVIAELGVERMLNAEDGVAKTLFVPAIGAAGRL